MVWRVGDGHNLKIWKDPWLPRDCSRRPITPRGSNIISDVSELINPVTDDWDQQLVRDIFWEEDQKIILALPLNENWPNLLAWHYDSKGIFSVKGAYKVCREDKLRKRAHGSAQSNSNGSEDPLWQKIWNLNCPSKVKHFVWRFAQNSHPLRSNLIRRGMRIDPKCPVCNRFDEDGGHLFFKCKTVRHIWSHLQLETERVKLASMDSAWSVVGFILHAQEEKKVTMVFILWAWWSERNNIREGGTRRLASGISHSIRLHVAEFYGISVELDCPLNDAAIGLFVMEDIP